MSLNVFLPTLMPICGNHGGSSPSGHMLMIWTALVCLLWFSLLFLCLCCVMLLHRHVATLPLTVPPLSKTPKLTKRAWCYMWVKSSRAAVQTKLSFRQQPPEVIILNSSRHTRRSTVLLTVMIFSDSLSTLCSISAVLDPWIPVLMVDNWNHAASHSLYRNTRQLHDSHWTHWGETKHSSRV